MDPQTYVAEGREYRRIPLTQGQYAIVDAEHYDKLIGLNWLAHFSPNTQTFYALRKVASGAGEQVAVTMPAAVLNVDTLVDHRNGDTLDNRKSNLRSATVRQNAQNRKLRRTNQSGYKGVSRHRNGWQARITMCGRTLTLGTFPTAEDAAKAYDTAARRHFAEFARTNEVAA